MLDRVVVETTLRHSSASNGLAERAIWTIGEQLRTLRYEMQNRYKTRITPVSAIWLWMYGYAGFSGAGGVRWRHAVPSVCRHRLVQDLGTRAPWTVIRKETP